MHARAFLHVNQRSQLQSSCILYVSLIASDVCSIRMQVPCEVDITGYYAMIPVRREHICSIQSALKCAKREFKFNYRGILCHTRPRVKINE